MTPCLQGLLEIAHVCILLGIYSRIREEDWEITGNAVSAGASGFKVTRAYSIKNFMVAVIETMAGQRFCEVTSILDRRDVQQGSDTIQREHCVHCAGTCEAKAEQRSRTWEATGLEPYFQYPRFLLGPAR